MSPIGRVIGGEERIDLRGAQSGAGRYFLIGDYRLRNRALQFS